MNYTFSMPTAPAGYQLTAVNLTLYVATLGPPDATSTFAIYSGLDRTGTVDGSFSVTEPDQVGTYINISLPLSVLTGGFSLGYATNSSAQPILTTFTEGYSDFTQRPSVTFTYAVPEPSVALLAPLGLLAALRRRRMVV